MSWSNSAVMRRVSGYTVEDINDTEAARLVGDADRAVLNLATVFVYNEKLKGSINGSNVYFRTKHRPIADSDFDGSVDDSDVTVYRVDRGPGLDKHTSYTEATVTLVNARSGVIVLTVAPTVANAEIGIYADYRYLKGSLTAETLTLAANYYLAYLCACSISGRIPVPFVVGGITQREGMAGAVFYHRAIDTLTEGGYLSPEQTGEVPESEREP